MNRIRDLREDMDLRQIDVAEATGIDQKTLSNYETGKTQPDARALVALADFFHVSIDYLVGRTDAPARDTQYIIKELSKLQQDIERIKKNVKDD
ncbi:helix-turn-helix domain-containing protein [Gemmiger sp.]